MAAFVNCKPVQRFENKEIGDSIARNRRKTGEWMNSADYRTIKRHVATEILPTYRISDFQLPWHRLFLQ